MVATRAGAREGPADVRFGSEADMCSAKGHVRFTSESGHRSTIPFCRLEVHDHLELGGVALQPEMLAHIVQYF
jgi:hypothetical protein